MREFALPGTTARYAPDRVCAIRHLRLVLDVDVVARRIAGAAHLTLVPIVTGSPTLELDAVELEIGGVTRDGKPVAHRHDGEKLRVALGPVREGEALELAVTYAGSPRRGIYFIAPDEAYPDKPTQVWTQGQDEDSRFWFPCIDQPSEKATTEVEVTVPAGFFALSNGRLLADRKAGARRTLHWRFDVPHSCYLVTLVCGELAEIKDRWNGVDVTYYVAPGREADARRTLGRTPKMLALFSDRFGVAYPYEKYAQAFVADFIFGGMENTTATTLTDVVLYDERAALDWDADDLIAHELAHQWFGDLLTCRSWGEGWLNEGFATYAEYVWREHDAGRDEADVPLEESAEAYFHEDAARYRRTIATNVYDEPIDIFDHHLYDKGGRVLHMLRQLLGDDGFWRGLRHYLVKHRAGSVETRDLARAVTEATGRQLDWFFDQWVVKGAGHPELEVTCAWDADKQVVTVAVKQGQKVEGTTPLFRLPTAVELVVDGKPVRHAIEIDDRQHVFVLPAAREPSQIVFDPGRVLLASVKQDKPQPMWIAQLDGAGLAIDRRDAARELGKLGGARATAALARALGADGFWGVAAAAAEALGGLRTTAARDALLAAITTRHPKSRRHVVRALGGFRHDGKVAAALAGLVERGDPSYFVEAEACLALGKVREPGAFELLARAAQRESFTDVIRQHAYRGLAEARDERAAPILRAGTTYGRVSHGRRAAIAALVELCRGRRDTLERDARERAEELLEDKDFRVQAAAIEALAQLGDPVAIPALRRVIERELDGRLRRRSREIIRDLEDGKSQGAQVSGLRDEVDKLRGEVVKLREALDALPGTGDRPTPTPAGRGKAAAARPAKPGRKRPARATRGRR